MVTVWQGSSSTCQRHHSTVFLLHSVSFQFDIIPPYFHLSEVKQSADLRTGRMILLVTERKRKIWFTTWTLVFDSVYMTNFLMMWLSPSCYLSLTHVLLSFSYIYVNAQWSKKYDKNSGTTKYFGWTQYSLKSNNLKLKVQDKEPEKTNKWNSQ